MSTATTKARTVTQINRDIGRLQPRIDRLGEEFTDAKKRMAVLKDELKLANEAARAKKNGGAN